ncbi:hypothetical protein MIND_00621400 [Mycena indigotica]|uniref:Uncharacterized protein n=1 Tax=Mycena indigotica TaxID=2126181 RepID=A0A8H6W999_9AGAR|nr:uncharacterized protein MIND_00621400 [Mycena indigotica]KAF7303909.1 hypothetical protein MIND_00621400 [Mycena indigotica]
MGFSPVTIHIVIVVVESLLFGAFLVLFCAAVYLKLTRSNGPQGLKSLLAFATAALALTCTGHWIAIVVNFVRAFRGPTPAEHAIHYYSTHPPPAVSILISIWIGDGIMIHRLWAIWGRNRMIVVLPLLAWCALLGSGTAGLVSLYHGQSYNRATTTVGLILNTAIIFYCTAFIAGRLYHGPHQDARTLHHLAAIVIESAVILALWTLFYAITLKVGNDLRHLSGALMPQVIGISHVLIYLRIALGWSQTSERSVTSDIVMTNPASIIEVNLTDINTYDVESDGGRLEGVAGSETK